MEEALPARPETGMHVLLVDDDAHVRSALGALLAQLGYEVTAAANGLEALSRVGTREFRVALVDLFMPTMDGLELIPKLRFQSPHTHVIAMSGGYMGGRALDLLRAAERAGAERTLAKPFTVEELQAAIAAVLEGEATE